MVILEADAGSLLLMILAAISSAVPQNADATRLPHTTDDM